VFEINLNIDETYIKRMIQFCNEFIEKYRLKFSLEQFIFDFDRITPMIDASEKIVKVYGNLKEEIEDKNIRIPAPNKDGKEIIGAKRLKKTKKQIFYFGKKDREKYREDERKIIYTEVIQFCNYLRQLKTFVELKEETRRIDDMSKDVDKMILYGF
jgi:hypothetical protein